MTAAAAATAGSAASAVTVETAHPPAVVAVKVAAPAAGPAATTEATASSLPAEIAFQQAKFESAPAGMQFRRKKPYSIRLASLSTR